MASPFHVPTLAPEYPRLLWSLARPDSTQVVECVLRTLGDGDAQLELRGAGGPMYWRLPVESMAVSCASQLQRHLLESGWR